MSTDNTNINKSLTITIPYEYFLELTSAKQDNACASNVIWKNMLLNIDEDWALREEWSICKELESAVGDIYSLDPFENEVELLDPVYARAVVCFVAEALCSPEYERLFANLKREDYFLFDVRLRRFRPSYYSNETSVYNMCECSKVFAEHWYAAPLPPQD